MEAQANTNMEKAAQSVKELTDKLERLGKGSEAIPPFPTLMVKRRIQTARNLLFQLIGHEWGRQKCKDIISSFNEICFLLDLLALHYRTLLQNQKGDHPDHKQVEALFAELDELSDTKKMFEQAIRLSDKKVSPHSPSLADIKTFIKNSERKMKVSYTPAVTETRSTPPGAAAAARPPTPPRGTSKSNTSKAAAGPTPSTTTKKVIDRQGRAGSDRNKPPVTANSSSNEKVTKAVHNTAGASSTQDKKGPENRNDAKITSILKSGSTETSKRKRSRSSSRS